MLDEVISAANGYVMMSLKHNRAMFPALAHSLNYFGASRFAFKPFPIVTCSIEQLGSAKPAMALRDSLPELGCLSVSVMVHIPKVQEALAEDGTWVADSDNWNGYLGRTLTQLDWST